MTLRIDWDQPVLAGELVPRLQPGDLDDFYAGASGEEAARLALLTAYYLFVPLTPPGSQALALHYIREAITLDPRAEYREWLALMEQGN